MSGSFARLALEHRHDLRHDEHQQARDDGEAHDREDDRIEHGAEHPLAQQLAVLGVVGEALEDRYRGSPDCSPAEIVAR